MVAGPQEAAGENTLDWSEFDEETIDCALNFCYGRNYIVPWGRQSRKDTAPQETAPSTTEHSARSGSSHNRRSYTGEDIVLHAKVYPFAHRSLAEDLEQCAVVRMKYCFQPFLKEY
ncbi:hypothetical protein AAEP93_006362 [Penicillium crustosum]